MNKLHVVSQHIAWKPEHLIIIKSADISLSNLCMTNSKFKITFYRYLAVLLLCMTLYIKSITLAQRYGSIDVRDYSMGSCFFKDPR